MTLPVDLEGSLYFAEGEYESAEPLFDEIKRSGHLLGLSSTSREFDAPFVRTGGKEIIGERAIRAHFGLPEAEDSQPDKG